MAFVEGLAGFVEQYGYGVLLPGSDTALLAISRHRERLEPRVRLGLPPHEAVERALDRNELETAAGRVGLPVSTQRVCDGLEAGIEAARELGFPVMVKPLRVVSQDDGSLTRHWSARADDEDSLRRIEPRLGPRYIVQGHEPGAVVSVGGVLGGGELLGVAASRYLRTWEPEAGNVAFSETIAPGAVAEAAASLVRELGWEGIFELELIERGDGSFVPIDFNPRVYGSITLAVRAGANLPAIWARRVLGDREAPLAARPGVRYRWEDADVRHALWQLRRGRVRAGIAAARPHRSVAHAYFRALDPMPFLVRLGSLATDGRARKRRSARPGG
ncbi:MAG: ATP-grasp domain-containing protein [Thermoleophilaceae bacterium]